MTLEELQERRAKRKEANAKARLEQEAIDREAIDALEEEHGADNVAALEVNGFVKGLPALVVVRSPGGTPFYKRYVDQVRKANKNTALIGRAQELLGESCIVYPTDETVLKQMQDQFPGLHISAGIRAIKFVELEAEEEKKD